MKKVSKVISMVVSTILVVSLTGCGSRLTGSKDGDGAYNAFNSFLKAYPENIGFHKALSHWGFKLPGGEKFEWSKDTSANVADYAMVMLADPFIKAGLDVKKLDENQWLYKPAEKEDGQDLPNRLVKPYNINDKKQNSDGSADAFRRLIKADSKLVKYHKEMQHYRLVLGDGFEVQWSEKPGLNDADIIFVLKAEPLIKAGLDVKKLEASDSGWKFRAASNDDMGSNPDQLVKIYKVSK